MARTNALPEEVEKWAQGEYWGLFKRSGYLAEEVYNLRTREARKISPDDIEIADFGLSDGDYKRFLRTGLGIITLINEDECKKILISLGSQVLPWHQHGKKEETFRFQYGEASLWVPCDKTERTAEPYRQIPEEHMQVKAAKEILCTPGLLVHISKKTPHLVIGGSGGCVYSEASTRSTDASDVFLHPGIRRIIR